MALLRFLILVTLGAGLSLALAAWRHVPDGPDPLFGRMQAYVAEAVRDLPELASLSDRANQAEQALLAPDTSPATGPSPDPSASAGTPSTTESPATAETPATAPAETAPAPGADAADTTDTTDTTRADVRTMIDARERLHFWYEVALGTGMTLFGGFLGGIGRRRRVAVAEYP